MIATTKTALKITFLVLIAAALSLILATQSQAKKSDGDQDLVLATATQPLLFTNDGKGHFTAVPDAFRFAHPLKGVLTSARRGA